MTTAINTSCSEYTIVLSGRRGVSACMYFPVKFGGNIGPSILSKPSTSARSPMLRLSPSSDQNLVHFPGNVIDMMTSGFSKLTQ